MVVDSEWYEPASNSTEDIEAAERTMLFTVSNTSSLMIYLNLFLLVSMVGMPIPLSTVTTQKL